MAIFEALEFGSWLENLQFSFFKDLVADAKIKYSIMILSTEGN